MVDGEGGVMQAKNTKQIAGPVEIVIHDYWCENIQIRFGEECYPVEDEQFTRWCRYFIGRGVGGSMKFSAKGTLKGELLNGCIVRIDKLKYEQTVESNRGSGYSANIYMREYFAEHIFSDIPICEGDQKCHLVIYQDEDVPPELVIGKRRIRIEDQNFIHFALNQLPKAKYKDLLLDYPAIVNFEEKHKRAYKVNYFAMRTDKLYEYPAGYW